MVCPLSISANLSVSDLWVYQRHSIYHRQWKSFVAIVYRRTWKTIKKQCFYSSIL